MRRWSGSGGRRHRLGAAQLAAAAVGGRGDGPAARPRVDRVAYLVVGSRRAHTPTRKWPAACLGPVGGARAPADATSLYALQGLRSARSRRVLTGSCGRLRPRPPREQQAAELAAPPQLERALRPEPRPQAAAAAQVAQSTQWPVALARPKGTRGPVVGTVSV